MSVWGYSSFRKLNFRKKSRPTSLQQALHHHSHVLTSLASTYMSHISYHWLQADEVLMAAIRCNPL